LYTTRNISLRSTDLWFMPPDNLHMTALEVTHSKAMPEIEDLVQLMGERPIEAITDYTYTHRARLFEPLLSFDTAAIALSFLPAAGEALKNGRESKADEYTYHHLRRDLYDSCQNTGIDVGSRYVVPSAHLTIARFVTQDVYKEGKVAELVEGFDKINEDLRSKYWPEDKGGDQDNKDVVQWVVGEEKGLECRMGRLWYGGGQRVRLGEGS